MTWNLDPIAFSLFGLDVRWYGLSYVLGFFLVLIIGHKIILRTGLKVSKSDFENLVFGLFFIGIVGGRLGEFLFYAPQTFLEDPLEVFKIWHGGMSIHGGILAAILFGVWWAKKHKISFYCLADSLVIPLAIALGVGRIANFINGELVGIPTDQSWGVIFPHVDDLFRHPSQLYEAGKNFILAGLLMWLLIKDFWKKPGFLFSVFLIGYGVLRFIIEFCREPDGMIWVLSTGQVLCLGMVVFGLTIRKFSFT